MHYSCRNLIAYVSVVLILFLSPFAVFASKLYSDIPPGHWSENAADVLSEQYIMPGISTNEFGGSLVVTRSDTAKIIIGLINIQKKYIPINLILLNDVKAGHPDFQVIMKVLSAGLMEHKDYKFNGEKKITRYEFASHIIKTLDYLQVSSPSIRRPPKSLSGISPEKKDIVDRIMNYWQLTDGYQDWNQNISRYEALEMVTKAAIAINPEIKDKIGTFIKSSDIIINPTPEPINTSPFVTQTPEPTPVIITPVRTPTPVPVRTPIPVRTIVPTPVRTPVATPVPTPVSTPVVSSIPFPSRTPVISDPVKTPSPEITPFIISPTPEISPVFTPTPVPTPIVSLPIPSRTPVISVPSSTPEPSFIPTPEPTAIQSPPSAGQNNLILRNQVNIKGIFNFLYKESIPSVIPVSIEPVRSKDDTPGLSVAGDVTYWFNNSDIFIVKDMGITGSFSSLGSYIYPTPSTISQADTEIDEVFKGNIGVLYKFVRTPEIEVAGGLDSFYRITSRSSVKPVNSYWRASKNYLGIGAKGILGWKVMDRLTIETSLAFHYVSQSLNETITSGTGSTIPGGTIIDRFNLELTLDGKIDILQIGNSWLLGDIYLGSKHLLGDGSQTIIGGGVGTGITF